MTAFGLFNIENEDMSADLGGGSESLIVPTVLRMPNKALTPSTPRLLRMLDSSSGGSFTPFGRDT
jgi:hypothetical protein